MSFAAGIEVGQARSMAPVAAGCSNAAAVQWPAPTIARRDLPLLGLSIGQDQAIQIQALEKSQGNEE